MPKIQPSQTTPRMMPPVSTSGASAPAPVGGAAIGSKMTEHVERQSLKVLERALRTALPGTQLPKGGSSLDRLSAASSLLQNALKDPAVAARLKGNTQLGNALNRAADSLDAIAAYQPEKVSMILGGIANGMRDMAACCLSSGGDLGPTPTPSLPPVSGKFGVDW